MARRISYPFVGGAAILMALLCFAIPHYSQQVQTESSIDVPILKVTCSDGHWARTPILEGQVLTWVDENTGTGFSFTPELLSDGKSVRVKIDRIEAMGKRVPLENLKLSVGARAEASTKSPYKIEIQVPLKTQMQASVKQVGYRPATLKPAPSSAAMFAQCCVQCGPNRICANCSVQMDCGCCCTPADACCALCQ